MFVFNIRGAQGLSQALGARVKDREDVEEAVELGDRVWHTKPLKSCENLGTEQSVISRRVATLFLPRCVLIQLRCFRQSSHLFGFESLQPKRVPDT